MVSIAALAVSGGWRWGAGGSLHFFLNWRAERRWEQFCEEERARGVKLHLGDFAPPVIPEDQNFAALSMFLNNPGGAEVIANSAFALPRGLHLQPATATRRDGMDWAAIQVAFLQAGFLARASSDPIRDTLLGLEHYAPEFRQWTEGRRRPQSRFPLDWDGDAETISFPHLGVFLNAAKVFHIKARAHLELRESEPALGAFVDAWHGYFALKREPTFITALVRLSAASQFTAVVGEGLRAHAWTEVELAQIEDKLAGVRLWEDFRWALLTERGYGNTTTDALVSQSPAKRAQVMSKTMEGGASLGLGYPQIPYADVLFMFVPRRVYRENQIRSNRYFHELLGAVGEGVNRYDFDHDLPSSTAHIEGEFRQLYSLFGGITASTVDFVVSGTARVQGFVDQARIAVALERFRIRNGVYPPALQDLEPGLIAVLPHDVYADRGYHYRMTTDGGYSLYGFGADRADDAGSEARDDVWIYGPPGSKP